MNDKKINFRRIIEFVKPERLFMSISLLNGIFFVIFNSISIWLTASLVNNVLIDFDQLVLDQERLLDHESPNLNERLKIAVNEFILRETNIETLKVLCISIILIFHSLLESLNMISLNIFISSLIFFLPKQIKTNFIKTNNV